MARLITVDGTLAVTKLEEQHRLVFHLSPVLSLPLLSPSPNAIPPAALPMTPRICRALPMRALQRHSFPETRTSRSGATLPSDCHAASHQSDAQCWMIPHHGVTKLARCVGFVVTTPWQGICLPCTQKNIIEHLPCLFNILTWQKNKSCIFRVKEKHVVNTCLVSPLQSSLLGVFLCFRMLIYRAID